MPKPNLLLLPGLLCDERLFAPQMTDLAEVADPQVPDLSRDASIEAMARRVLAQAPARFSLLGLSMGGYVALEIMRRTPERVERLALLDSQARADSDASKARRRGLIELSARGQFHGVTPQLLPLYVHPSRLGDAALTGMVQAMAGSLGQEAFIRQETAIMGRIDSRPGLPDIACPTLVLAGREDVATPPELQQEMAGLIPDATLVLLPRCGHLTTLERPEAVTRQLRAWLAA